MKYIEEYRNPATAHALAAEIARTVTRPWTIMEVCGGQTHAILRFGIDHLLPPSLRLIHGPGCPVCVTPAGLIDQAVTLTKRHEVILCSFGDMLRVPGHKQGDLLHAKAAGGDVRVVYSPLDALALACREPSREVVFFAIGFETTAPANAMAAHQALTRGVTNFSLLVSQVLVAPAMDFILRAPGIPSAGVSGSRSCRHRHRRGRTGTTLHTASRARGGDGVRAGQILKRHSALCAATGGGPGRIGKHIQPRRSPRR